MKGYRCYECGAYLDPAEHCDCMKKEEPPRSTASAPKNNLHDYDSIPKRQMQEAIARDRYSKAWREYDHG